MDPCARVLCCPSPQSLRTGHLRLGAQALSMPVFSLGRRDAHRNRVDDEDHDPRKRFVLKWTNCPLCGIAPLDVFHLACICTSPLLIDWRNHIIPDVRRLLINISSLLSEAHSNMGHDVSDLCDEVDAEASAFDFDSDAGRFILFRLLICLPWSSRLAPDDLTFYTVTVLGELFDEVGVPNRFLRPVANLWCHWCIRWGWRLGDAWRSANTQAGLRLSP